MVWSQAAAGVTGHAETQVTHMCKVCTPTSNKSCQVPESVNGIHDLTRAPLGYLVERAPLGGEQILPPPPA